MTLQHYNSYKIINQTHNKFKKKKNRIVSHQYSAYIAYLHPLNIRMGIMITMNKIILRVYFDICSVKFSQCVYMLSVCVCVYKIPNPKSDRSRQANSVYQNQCVIRHPYTYSVNHLNDMIPRIGRCDDISSFRSSIICLCYGFLFFCLKQQANSIIAHQFC